MSLHAQTTGAAAVAWGLLPQLQALEQLGAFGVSPLISVGRQLCALSVFGAGKNNAALADGAGAGGMQDVTNVIGWSSCFVGSPLPPC